MTKNRATLKQKFYKQCFDVIELVDVTGLPPNQWGAGVPDEVFLHSCERDQARWDAYVRSGAFWNKSSSAEGGRKTSVSPIKKLEALTTNRGVESHYDP